MTNVHVSQVQPLGVLSFKAGAIFCLVGVLACPSGLRAQSPSQPSSASAPAAAAPVVDILESAQTDAPLRDQYRQHIEFLSNPFMEGRGPGTRGNRIAAEYVAFELRRLGLEPSGTQTADSDETGRYLQTFTAGRRASAKSSALSVQSADGVVNIDHLALGFSGSGAVEAPIVFVGYGLEKAGPDKAYSSFTDADDFSGKVVVLLRFEPMDTAGVSVFKTATDSRWSPASSLGLKLDAVLKRNAAGVLLVNTPGAADPRLLRAETTEGSARWIAPSEKPVALLGAAQADALLKAIGSPDSLQKLREQADVRGFTAPLGTVPVKMSVEMDRTPRTTWNVLGVLPGSGTLAEEFVIVGAHYDHVGYGHTGGSRSDEYGVIHPGADDNASGSSGMLVAADLVKKSLLAGASAAAGQPGGADRRSVLFIGFSAEEMGLIGSREFLKSSPISTGKMYAMVNLDMIGRLRDNQLELAGTGTAEGFEALLDPLLSASGLSIKKSPGGRGPSDHASFYAAGIPVLHLFTGLHDQYHTPRDTVDLINIDGAVRVAKLTAAITEMLATRTQPLVFKSTDRAKIGADGDQPSPSMGSIKVRFGIAPGNYADDKSGVVVGEVYPGTSSAEAGIAAGDRLTRWNGEPISDVAGWMSQLAKHNPGDVVDVTLARANGGAEEVVRVTLKSRDQAPR